MNHESKTLGILGGMGPMATVYFYELVTRHTMAARDQDHLDIVVASRASIPDRTAYILAGGGEDPAPMMQKEAERLVAYGAGCIAIPCNTAHFFYGKVSQVAPVPVLDMVELAVDKVARLGFEKIGLLATDGTICTNIYQDKCRDKKIVCEVPPPEGQKALMQVIYGDIKAGKRPDMEAFRPVAEELFAAGCQCLVLACTELSLLKRDGLLDERYLDSMDVLAEAAIAACGKTAKDFCWPAVRGAG